MRIATWNLDHGGSGPVRAAQEKALAEVCADVVVLTEPPPTYRSGSGVVASPAQRPSRNGNESWVAIVGAGVEPVDIEIPYKRMSAAARVTSGGQSVIVYGSVLPWRGVRAHAPDVVEDGEDFIGAFLRVLEAQKNDIAALQSRGESVVWAGDFNQSLGGANRVGSSKGRRALQECLDDLGLAAWNGDALHADQDLLTVDLICGPKDLEVAKQGRIDPVRDGVKMSDHAGYWVDLDIVHPTR